VDCRGSLSRKIRNILAERRGQLTTIDDFTAKLIDIKSQLEIVKINNPSVEIE